MSFLFDDDESKVADASALTYTALGIGGSSRTGLPVNEYTALRVSAVYACCRVIAEDIAKLPLRLMQENRNGSKKILYDNPLHRLLSRRPNEWQSSFEWRATMVLHALLCRSGYSLINRGADGSVLELIPILPQAVIPRQLADWTVVYDVRDGRGGMITVPRENMHVLHGLSWNGFSALDMIHQGSEAIGLAMAIEQTQAVSHGNGAKLGGLLSTTSVLKQEQIDRLKDQFQQNNAGVQNAFKMLVLDNGFKFEPWSQTGVDGQHLETRKFQVEEVCRLLRVFPQMIGASSATPTYASAESFFGAHVVHTLMPWVVNWEQAMLRDLISEDDVRNGVEAKFDMNALLRGSADQRATYYESAIARAGWMSRNEARRMEDLDPLPGLDTILPPAGSTSPAPAGPPAPLPPGKQPPKPPPG
jgi:HK97 family phage portal protein